MKIYVTGGSSELDLVSSFMARLREAGHVITHDWPAVVREVGHANPRDATDVNRILWAEADLRGIEAAKLVWLLLPAKTSFGAAFEAGYALASRKLVVMSGDTRATIFSSLATACFTEHEDAFQWIRRLPTCS